MARVLVVDDDPDLLGLMEIQLRHHGHRVLTASNGPAALELVAERGAPEIAVLDVAMPVMNGFELLQAFRAQRGLPPFPVIFLSARVTPRDVDAGLALDALYLTKPYVMNALLDAIERSLVQPDAAAGDW